MKIIRSIPGLLIIAFVTCSCTPAHIVNKKNGDLCFSSGDVQGAESAYARNYEFATNSDKAKKEHQYDDKLRALHALDYGTALWTSDKYNEAVEVFQHAVELNSLWEAQVTGLGPKKLRAYRCKPYEIGMVHLLLGIHFFNNSKFESAAVEFRKSLEAESRLLIAEYLLGHTSLILGEYEDAESCFRATIAADPYSPYGYLGLLRTLASLKDYDNEFSTIVSMFLKLAQTNEIPEPTGWTYQDDIETWLNSDLTIILRLVRIRHTWDCDILDAPPIITENRKQGSFTPLGAAFTGSTGRAVSRQVREEVKKMLFKSIFVILGIPATCSEWDIQNLSDESETRRWVHLSGAIVLAEVPCDNNLDRTLQTTIEFHFTSN